jgi:hypothetical protein
MKNQELSLEGKIEKEKQLKLDVLFLHGCKTADDVLSRIDELMEGGDVETLMLDEYELEVNDVINSGDRLSAVAQEKTINIVMAPDNNDENQKTVSWEDRKQQLQAAGISFEEDTIPEDGRLETIGFFFGKDGRKYAFPKMMWGARSVHKIPETDIGVTICGEINHIKPEELEDIRVLYNPSREADDPYLKYRMLGLSNPNITREEIVQEMMKDDFYASYLDDSKWSEDDEIYDPKLDSREAREKRFNESADKLWQIAREDKYKNSMYVENIGTILSDKKIPVVRCDGDNASGLLNPLKGMEGTKIEYGDRYGRLKSTFQG